MTQSTEQERAGRYTKKPVTIEAVQWFKHGDHPDVRQVTDSDHLYFTGMGGATLKDAHIYGVMGTLESPNHLVTPGDWIIRGVKGELYPCKPDVFAATYEPEQAARRAQVVPISDELPQGFISDVLTAAGMVRHGKQCKALADRLGDAIEKIWTTSIAQRKALAAAPQPPEAAPVQMPLHAAEMVCSDLVGFLQFNEAAMQHTRVDGVQKLYTEHQVRQLLAQHGVK